jgi:uncharacterized phiE125 gp8 family phage protein
MEEIRATDKLITAATGSVVSMQEFKQHLRWPSDDSSEDLNLNRKLQAAIDDFKDFTGRPVLAESWRMLFDKFYSRVTLTKAPVTTASISVKYYDSENALQTLAPTEYKVIDGGDYGMTKIEFTGSIPGVYDRAQPVYIDYTAGWTVVPSKVIAGILEQASDYFEYRSSDSKRPLVPSSYRAWYSYKLFHSQL